MDLLLWLKAALLGIVEGATEFIPVSSTGHLILTQTLLGFEGAKENAFVIFIQLGAILAVVWAYRAKLTRVALDWPRHEPSRRLILNLVIGTLPAIVVGLPTEAWIEAQLFKPVPVALALIAGGIAILIIESRSRAVRAATIDDLTWRLALGVGLIQVLSIIWPGISRSGATILGGLVLGLSRVAATEFSFFLAIPAMLGASMIKLAGVRDQMGTADLPVFAIGFAVSFIVALLVIKWLIAFVSRHSFVPFAWYRIGAGAAVLAAVALGLAKG